MIDGIGLFLFITGFVLGLGGVTVIDLHGFLARKSAYWTEATTRTHKVTKPLIWSGTFLALLGGVIFYRAESLSGIPLAHAVIATVLILNGCFLTFSVSPFLLAQEKAGHSGKLLSASWQRRITLSFIISDLGWWSGLVLLVMYLMSRLQA